MVYAKWNNKKFPILNSIEINKSSREVTFSDITVDFRGKTIEDLPYYLQETEIIDEQDNVMFIGYIETYKLPQIQKINSIKMELNITLLSPRKLTTKRIVTYNNTDKLTNIINYVLAPLEADGFYIKEMNVPNKTMTLKVISKTIEEIMNIISSKQSIYWNIDTDKGITVNSIEYMFGKTYRKQIDINNYKEELKGLMYITPKVEGVDYANVINISNARVFYEMSMSDEIILKNGDILTFDNPIAIGSETTLRISKNPDYITQITHIGINYLLEGTSGYASVIGYIDNGVSTVFNGIGKDDNENKTFTLQMDTMFKNLATGIKYNGEQDIIISLVFSESALRYSNMKLINWEQIDEMKNVVTPSGQIEKVVDVSERWFTIEELIDYANILFVNNDKNTNEVIISYDKKNNLNIGDRIVIDLPEYLVQGNFIITDITQTKEKNNPYVYTVTLRNTGLLENFIDLFRANYSEDQEEQISTDYIIEYSSNETVIEISEVTSV